jgi:3'-phosphoadenosine 5'-phosphosulfate sulfotransferase (PAPS reductase)/FAD synthetase
MPELIRTTNLLEAIPKMAGELARVSHPDDTNAERLLYALEEQGLRSSEDAHTAFIALAGALNDYAEPGDFFGPRPGQPESLGYWPLPDYEMNAIRHELGNLDEEALRKVFEERKAESKHPPIPIATKIAEARDALAVIEELQEAGAMFVHNNSGGKDSQAMLIYMVEVLGIPAQQIVSIHADLGELEWEQPGRKNTREIAEELAGHYGIEFFVVKQTGEIPLLERVTERVMTHVVKGRYEEREGGEGYELAASPFPSGPQRWCTSDYKTAPCEQLSTDLALERGLGRMRARGRMDATRAFIEGRESDPKARDSQIDRLQPYTKAVKGRRKLVTPTFIVHGLGLRAEESDDRGDSPILEIKYFTSASTKTKGPLYLWRWLPIQLLTADEVFRMIAAAGQEPHWIYGEGLTRASCSFCIYASPKDMTLAAKLRPDLYARYVALEKHYGKSFAMSREFLEDMTNIQADEALVSQYRRDLVPVEELIEKYGGIFPKGTKAPETELKKYRRLGFREEEKLVPAESLLRKRRE